MWKEWEILLVDDEPDVLSVSKLAMRNFEVFGIPVKLHTAESKAEALEIFKNAPELLPTVAVGFIDVVMETDEAGLELCQYIREEMGNKFTQLFIRTGQPGIAPEREVIDRYDISGYFTKVEATEDKLYSLVKSGVRQYMWSRQSLSAIKMLDALIAGAGSREKMGMSLGKLGNGFFRIDGKIAPTFDYKTAMLIGGKIRGKSREGIDEVTALQVRSNSR